MPNEHYGHIVGTNCIDTGSIGLVQAPIGQNLVQIVDGQAILFGFELQDVVSPKRRRYLVFDLEAWVLLYNQQVYTQRLAVQLVFGVVYKTASVASKLQLYSACKTGVPTDAVEGH